MSFKPIDPKKKWPQLEEEVLAFWDEDKTFTKSIEQREGAKDFIFYEGPPTANGKPGIHHALARAFKDVIPRYKTMKGYRVERKAGWDTHGLPVELQVEKQLGLKNKQEIENIVPGDPRQSVIDFNQKCKESVWEYKDLWTTFTKRMGYWVDLEHPYITYEDSYIENVWWVLQQMASVKDEQGNSIVYKGHKVVPYCYRCGTALSTHELAQGYQTIKDNSVYVKMKLKDQENTYFLVWTTTPWTLPGNVALALGKDFNYVKVKNNNEFLILVKDRLSVLQGDYEIVEEMTGEDLAKVEYEPLFTVDNPERKKAYFVILGDFVSTVDGTGIVHIAPAFGIDDELVSRENNLPVLNTVNEKGEITANVPGQGIPIKKKNDKNRYEVDDLIMADLKSRGLFYQEESYEHEYPFCWRCDTPLIYLAKPSWFVKMSLFADELVKNNNEINWIPEHIKQGRFGEWLSGVKDWAISRDRYWGTPLPIWQCDQCDHFEIIGSKQEVEEKSGKKLGDLHKPYIDEVEWKCACGGQMKRVPEVMDVWFDSGSMPTAQFGYPNSATTENKQKIESGAFYPADYISEAIDQTRGWFYTLLAISTVLNKAGQVPTGFPYRNVICLAHINDKNGKKMSKSRGNVVDPFDVMNQFGADIMRWYMYTINQPGVTKRFDPKGLQDINNRLIRMLANSYSFFAMYANTDNWQFSFNDILSARTHLGKNAKNVLDQILIIRLNETISFVEKKLDDYDVYSACKEIERFVDYLSNKYIRRSRKRFWKSENDEDKIFAYLTLYISLVEISKLIAPFMPFITEYIYLRLTDEKESVHLQYFPQNTPTKYDRSLIAYSDEIEKVIEMALFERAKNKIKVRQPLSSIVVILEDSLASYFLTKEEKKFIENKENFQLIDILKEEINVKNVEIYKDLDFRRLVLNDPKKANEILDGKDISTNNILIKLNTVITPELKLEGLAREIVRHIQEARKAAGFNIDDRIEVGWQTESEVIKKTIGQFGNFIGGEILAERLEENWEGAEEYRSEIDIEQEKLQICLQKIKK